MRKLITFYAKSPSHYHVLEWFGIFYMLVNFRIISKESFVQLKRKKTLIELRRLHSKVNKCCKVLPHLRGSV